MRGRVLAVVAGWLAVVGACTTVGLTVVYFVGQQVEPAGYTTLSQAQVKQQVREATAAQGPSGTRPGAASSPADSNSPEPDSSAITSPDSTGPSGTTSPGGQESPQTSPPRTSPASSSQQQSASFVLNGGSVVLICTGTTASGRASPRPGYEMETEDTGDRSRYEVKFRSGGHDSTFEGSCATGLPVGHSGEKDATGGAEG